MRLRKKMIDHIAKTVTDRLLDHGLLTVDGTRETVMTEVSRLITADLMIEDRLNEEVKELLRAHTAEIERGNIDYARMFTMVKRKLVQERGLIL
jgi:uncharacterized protein